MLKNPFIHIPGIGAVTEQRLWASGITSWDSPLKATPGNLSAGRKNVITKELTNPDIISNRVILHFYQIFCLQTNPGAYFQNSENRLSIWI